ncbi:MAG: IS66 family insertion sequence element accessory protein TnpB [Pararheinheimera sp.]|nr:IS66 family insertion sequence element accessory protein TnpB [Rheinheimera sp.]
MDFRKYINGLSLLVKLETQQSLFSCAPFAFFNQQRSLLELLCWDETCFYLWCKDLEKDKFRWARLMSGKVLSISELRWLLQPIEIQ